MSRAGSRRIEGAKLAAVLIASSLTLTSGRSPALGQPLEGYALAYISIPLDGSADAPTSGLRFDLGDGEGGEAGDLGPRSRRPPPVFEVRFGAGEEPAELRLGGIAPAMIADRADLDGGAALWIWTGVGLAAVAAIVVAADAICIGINTTCSKDNDDDEDEVTDEPTGK